MDDPDPIEEDISDLFFFSPAPSANGAVRLDISLVHQSGDWQLSNAICERLCSLIRESVERSGVEIDRAAELSVVLSSDEDVRALNGSYRSKDKSTNVLSFPANVDPAFLGDELLPLGDVILALETVQREATGLGLEPEHHVYHLCVHGVLHLLGFDHEDDVSAKEMEGLETEILLGAGLHNPYEEGPYEEEVELTKIPEGAE